MVMKVYGSITITDVTDGKQFYTWIMYADDENGTNMSSDPTDKVYIGHAYNQTEPTPDEDDPTLYEWALFANKTVSETKLYYASASDKTPPEISDAAMASGYWVADFPTTWSSDTYIWTTTRTEWANGDITYSPDPPTLISQIEAATMSAQSSQMSLAEWCALNDVTIIDGSTIATGSIDASKISVTDLNAFRATIGGWEIGESKLYSSNGNVGLFSGFNLTEQSLLANEVSPIRFYAGKEVITEEEEISMEIIVNDVGPWTVSHTFDCDEIEFVRGFWEDIPPDEFDISIDGTTLILTADYGYYMEVSDFVYVAFVKKTTYGDRSNFMVLEDGSLYASAVDITGKIAATSGYIGDSMGGFEIEANNIHSVYKYYHNGNINEQRSAHMTSYNSLDSDGLYFYEYADKNFVYVGTDGIGLMHTVTYMENYNDNSKVIDRQTWMADGKLFSNSAEITGKITATSGYIGGFVIEDEKIYTGSKSSFSNFMNPGVYIGPDGIVVGGALSVRPDLTTYYAGVSLDATTGKLIANNAEITGKIIATEGEFTGKITATSGYIGSLTIMNNALKTTYSYSLDGKEYISYLATPSGVPVSFVEKLSVEETKTFTYLGNDGFGNVVVCGTEDADTACIVKSRTYIQDGLLSFETLNPYISGSYARSTVGGYGLSIDSEVEIGGDISSLRIESGGSYLENGLPTACIFRVITDGSLHLKGDKGGRLLGTWKLDSGAAVTSWRGAKHDIESLDDRYSILFDNINPVRFKYNNGQSDRYHTGFILDELKDAMNIACIDNSELAAYCIDNEETGDGGIRYEEIVALNTREVQKLKARVTELENRIATMTEQN